MQEYIPEIITAGTFGVVSWFCRGVLARLESITEDIHILATAHGERLARLETNSHAQSCTNFDFRSRSGERLRN